MSFETTIVQPALRDVEPLIVGREVRVFEAIDSTNVYLRDQAHAGATEGLLAIANEQTAGRGRLGRTWNAPPDTSVLLSVLLRPTWLAVSDSFLLTMLAAVVIAEAIEDVTDLEIDVKWPNDVQINGRKVAGILVDVEMQSPDRLEWAIIGSGINVNWQPSNDPTITQSATSLAAETGKLVDRSALIRAIVQNYDRRYLMLRNGQHEALRGAWIKRLTTLGQTVSVETARETFTGIAESVAHDGGLQVRRTDGRLQTVYAGDVRVRKHDN